MGDDGVMEIRRPDGSVIAAETAGPPGAAPVLLCHGLADSRLAAELFTEVAHELGLLIIVPDRPGAGRSDPRPLASVADWVPDAALVADELGAGPVAVAGMSAGGPFAAACAAALPGRFTSLTLISALGHPDWPTDGMAAGERISLEVARRVPEFGGWFGGRLAALARLSPELFMRLAASELPAVDQRMLARPDMREAFLVSYAEAFRQGTGAVAQDLRVLARPWGFRLDSITVPTFVHHGDADTTVPPQHARRYAEAIPGAQLRLHPGHGHFSITDAARQILAPLARPA
jgi:pimeloyl-ACP methyl ester carboxylesterase